MPKRQNPAPPTGPVANFQCVERELLAWYDAHRRDLPWRRRSHDPYAQLLAEFMLQQTQVATVIRYFERFITRCPTVEALAEAPRDQVLALWSGLGYYSRARNLHETARQIVERFGGRVPDNVDELMSLPGIGRYTAGAIASVAYDRRAPILDGNVTRVLARLFAVEGAVSEPRVRARLWTLAGEILPQQRCGDFNQALMELGATLCSPQSPQCVLCPLRRVCIAQRDALTDRIPPVRTRTAVKAMEIVAAAISSQGRLLFTRQPQEGLWGGLWMLPSVVVAGRESRAAARRRLQALLPVPAELDRRPLAPVRRALTHRQVTFHTYRGEAKTTPQALTNDCRWMRAEELDSVGLSSACRAILERAGFNDPGTSRAAAPKAG